MAQSESGSSTADPPETARAVTFTFLKGGSSKTTLAVNTARHLAERNGPGSTVFIDLDPNGHATRNYDYGYSELYEKEIGLRDVILGSEPDGAPHSLSFKTEFGFDIIPSTQRHEGIEESLSNEMASFARIRGRIVSELLGSEYQYIVIDTPSSVGEFTYNGVFASDGLILPLLPAGETTNALQRTQSRLVKPLEEQGEDVNILAMVPNMLSQRIDQQTTDRELLEGINSDSGLTHLIPDFARITEDEFEAIDAGEMTPPKPGIREAKPILRGMRDYGLPLLDHKPTHPQNDHFDELAKIVEQGGVKR